MFRLPCRLGDSTRLEYDEESHWFTSKSKSDDEPPSYETKSVRRGLVYLLAIDLSILLFLLIVLHPLITLWRNNEDLFRPTVTFPHHSDFKLSPPSPKRRSIPPILHQTCANATIPEIWVAPQQSCQDIYSHFEYMVSSKYKMQSSLHSKVPGLKLIEFII